MKQCYSDSSRPWRKNQSTTSGKRAPQWLDRSLVGYHQPIITYATPSNKRILTTSIRSLEDRFQPSSRRYCPSEQGIRYGYCSNIGEARRYRGLCETSSPPRVGFTCIPRYASQMASKLTSTILKGSWNSRKDLRRDTCIRSRIRCLIPYNLNHTAWH